MSQEAGTPLSSLENAIRRRLQGLAVQLDLRVVGAPPPGPIARSAQPLLAVRVTACSIHLACFAPAALVGAPCPECLDRRLMSMRTTGEQWAAQLGYPTEGNGAPFLIDSVCDTIGLLCRATSTHVLDGSRQQVWTLELPSQEVRRDELFADAFCSTCASGACASEEQARLALRAHVAARSGSSRIRGLLDYELPVNALVNPVCGAAAPSAIPGYVQSITAPVFGDYIQRAFDARPRTVTWSGLCLRTAESRVAGLLEALERQAGMLAHPAAVAAVDSYDKLAGRAMDPSLCFAYSEESYALGLGLTRFDKAMPIEWVWGYSLMQRRPLLVPRQLVYYDRIHPERRIKLIDNNSSGCALGACYEEAILKGLYELVERDSFVIAWHRRLSLPRIDPDSCLDRKTRLLLNRVDHLGFDIKLLDGRMDLKIPSVIALALRRDDEVGSLTVGAAASLDPEDAVRSALLECATTIVEIPAMFRAKEQHVRGLALDYSKVHAVMDHALLYAIPEMAARVTWLYSNPLQRSFDDCYRAERAWYAQGDIGADLEKVVCELQRCGLGEAVVVDLTTPEQHQLGLYTVRVIVPGLAPIDFGHPRNRVEHLPRLRTAPAVAGLAPAELSGRNPLPHPFP
jgi:ribosomal protein S12 methylthiotransferase accessory factor